jgi:hypothetical protein
MATNEEKKQRGTLINILDLDPAEGAKGISFDPDVEYTFKVTERVARKLISEKEGHQKEFTVVEMMCTEEESQATIKQSFFYNQKVIINDDDKLKESDVVKFARGTGYPVGVGKKFVFGDVVREGIVFKAHVKPQMQKDGKTPTGYSELDLLTVKAVKGSGAPKAQTKIGGSAEDEQFLIDMANGFANKTEMITGLSKIGKTSMINLLISLDDQGKLKYSK